MVYPAWAAHITKLSLLLNEVDLHQEYYTLYGRQVSSPRLVGFYGDNGITYRYSGQTHHALPWTPTLTALRDLLIETFNTHSNSVLVNYYREGHDYMGWHCDNEPELGPTPTIYSLSFGANRLFRLRHTSTREVLSYDLANGDLLIMAGQTQSFWQHALPKQTRVQTERLNLTFRYVYMSGVNPGEFDCAST